MALATKGIEEGVLRMRSDLQGLAGELKETLDSNRGIAEATGSIAGAAERYQSMTMVASAAIEEMIASIESMTGVSRRNRESVESLARSIAGGRESVVV